MPSNIDIPPVIGSSKKLQYASASKKAEALDASALSSDDELPGIGSIISSQEQEKCVPVGGGSASQSQYFKSFRCNEPVWVKYGSQGAIFWPAYVRTTHAERVKVKMFNTPGVDLHSIRHVNHIKPFNTKYKDEYMRAGRAKDKAYREMQEEERRNQKPGTIKVCKSPAPYCSFEDAVKAAMDHIHFNGGSSEYQAPKKTEQKRKNCMSKEEEGEGPAGRDSKLSVSRNASSVNTMKVEKHETKVKKTVKKSRTVVEEKALVVRKASSSCQNGDSTASPIHSKRKRKLDKEEIEKLHKKGHLPSVQEYIKKKSSESSKQDKEKERKKTHKPKLSKTQKLYRSYDRVKEAILKSMPDLVAIKSGKLATERRKLYDSGTKKDRFRLKQLALYGPVEDDEICDLISTSVSKKFVDRSGEGDTFTFAFDVLVPELIVRIIADIEEIDIEEADKKLREYGNTV
eukprot:Nk52_evm19s914 gene=Nk52_evmTU19s914